MEVEIRKFAPMIDDRSREVYGKISNSVFLRRLPNRTACTSISRKIARTKLRNEKLRRPKAQSNIFEHEIFYTVVRE